MPKANELKRGAVVRVKDQVCVVRHIDIRSPSSRGSNTLYKVRLQALQGKQKIEQTFKGEDLVEDVDFQRRAVQFSYREADMLTFMDNENYSQYTLSIEDLEEEAGYITEDLEDLMMMLVDDQPVGVQLPASVCLEIVETSPSIKGATVTKRTKPATLSTGLEVQVPEYISNGETIRINTDSGAYMSRV